MSLKLRLFIILAISLCSFNSYSNEEDDWNKLRQRNLQEGVKYNVSSGTGFFISNNYIITNAHVVQKCINISIRGAVPPSAAILYAIDNDLDLAVLQTNASPTRIAYLRSNNGLKVNDTLFIIGYPLSRAESGTYLMTSANVISMDDSIEKAREIEFTASIEHGNSGGPLIDSGGNVVGVIEAKKTYYETITDGVTTTKVANSYKTTGLAIGISTLKDFLQKYNLFFATNSTYDVFTNYRPDKTAKDYIVNIHCVQAN